MPTQWLDPDGREWPTLLDDAALARVRDEAGVDLRRLVEGPPRRLAGVLADLVLVSGVLWALHKPRAEALGVSEDDFHRLLSSRCYEHAALALMAALPERWPGRRVPIGRALIETKRRILEGASDG